MISLPVRCLASALAAAVLFVTPAAAQTTTVADGVNPSDSFACAGGPLTRINAFTVTSTATERIRGVRILLTPGTAYQLVETLQVRGGAGMAILATVAPTSEVVTVSFAAMDVPANTTVPFEIWVKPRGEAAMPSSQSGQDLQVQALARSAVSYYTAETTDTSAVLRIDNFPPVEATWTSVSPGTNIITLGWKGASDATEYLVLRRLGGPVSERLSDTGTYALNGPVGASTVAYKGTDPGFPDGAVTSPRTYYYRLFSKDGCGNWSNGIDIGPIVASPPASTSLEGDKRPNSQAPVVGILNPLPGVVGSPVGKGFKIQVRIANPFGGPITNPIVQVDDGTTSTPYPLVLNPKYGGDASTGGVFELQPLGTGLELAQGRYTLRASAANGYSGGTTVYSARVGIIVPGVKGDGNLLVRDNSSQLCSDCHKEIKTHSSDAAGTDYGSWYVGCRGCHTPHGTPNAALVASQIQPPAVNQILPPQKVQFSKRTGFYQGDAAASPHDASYANTVAASDPTARRTGPCQVCHTQTKYYRVDGNEPNAHYTNSCGSCHQHVTGFKGTGCTGCHGQEGRTAFSDIAPPRDSCNNLTTTGGTGINRVGAHAKHLQAGVTNGILCSECHINPPTRPDHALAGDACQPDKRALMTWGAVARGQVDTAWSPAVIPGWDPGSQTCSANYCHGNFTSSGVTSSVTWGQTLACDGCHGTPPLATHATTDTQCSLCHGTGYELPANGGITGAARATHVNGRNEITGTGCTMCHGDKARDVALAKPGAETTDDRFKSAPPRSTTVPGVPATQMHLTHVYSGTVMKAITCDTCHPVPLTGDKAGPHRDDLISTSFSALARLGGPGVVYSGPTQYTCSATWCHGDNFIEKTLGDTKGAVTVPAWNAANAAAKACTGCHKQPPTDPVHVRITSRNQTQTTDCAACHATTVTGGGAIIVNGDSTDKHINGVYDTTATCTSCHPNSPPLAVADLANAANTNGVGKHSAHAVTVTIVATAYQCTACHPTQTLMNHANGSVDMTFTGLGAGTGWNDTGSTCGTSYCHGSSTGTVPLFKGGASTGLTSKAQNAWGGTTGTNPPNWTDAGTQYKACTSCHGAPPTVAADHPSNPKCDDCHPVGATPTTGTPTGIAAASALRTNHLDGHVDVLRTGCTACHGDYGSDAVASMDVRSAPGYNVNVGRDAAGLTTGGTKIGGHNAHLQRTDLRSRLVRCDECHAVVAANDTAHANGAAAVDMAAATSTTAKVGGLSPTYLSGNCSAVYCHGAGYTSRTGYAGSNATLTWTDGTAARACGACHAVAPTSTVHNAANAATNPQNCNACHGAGYDCLKTSLATCTVDPVLHINGAGNFPTGCTDCHAQPPATGAHVAHVNQSDLRTATLDCDSCHGTKPVQPDVSHSDGVKKIGWSTLATANGTITATPNAAGFTTPVSCTDYCHGNTTATVALFKAGVTTGLTSKAQNTWGGTTGTTPPTWAGTSSFRACTSCHGAPPTATADHPSNPKCDDCHPVGSTPTTGAPNAITAASALAGNHLDGHVDVLRTGCTACHGDYGSDAVASTDVRSAPGYNVNVGRDAAGLTTGGTKIGAHNAHMQRTDLSNRMVRCDECHSVPATNDTLHADGTAAVGFAVGVSTTARSGGVVPQWAAGSPGTCNTVYCHGAGYGGARATNYGGTLPNPTWTSGTAGRACGACHKVAPTTTPHNAANNVLSPQNCNACHGAAYNCLVTNLNACQVDPVLHINGVGNFPTGCTDCHLQPPPDTSHLAHVNNTTLRSTKLDCVDCHGTKPVEPDIAHADGVIKVGWSNTATGNNSVTVSPANGAGFAASNPSCTTYCHQPGTAAAMGGTRTPTWGGSVDCGSCHGSPPPVTVDNTANHPQNTNCAACHGAGYDLTGITLLAKNTHMDVVQDKPANGCTACHGALAGRSGPAVTTVGLTVAPGYNGAGTDSHGGTTTNDDGVGAHDAHIRKTNLRSAALTCTDCHNTKIPPNNDVAHADDVLGMGWAQLATTGGVSPQYTRGSGCSATYCHGNFKNGNDQVGGGTPTVVPGAPGALSFPTVTDTAITVNWGAATDATIYKVERSPTGAAGSYVQIGFSSTTSYADAGLVAGTTYWYRVRAWNTVGDGAYNATPLSQQTTGGGGTPATATYNWRLNSGTTIAGMTTNWTEACGTYPTVARITTMTAAADACADRVYSTAAGPVVMVTMLAPVYAADMGISAGSFTVGLRAAGAGQYADFQLGYVTGGVFTGFGTPVQALAGNGVITTYSGATAIDLSSQTGTVLGTRALALRIRKVTTGTTEMRVYIGSTNGGALTVTETPAAAPPAPPPAPTGTPTLTVGAVTQTTAALTWTPTTNQSSYIVERGDGAAPSVWTQVGQPTVTSFTDQGLTANRVYSYRVRGWNVTGSTTNSTPKQATTPAEAAAGTTSWTGSFVTGSTSLTCTSCHGSPPGGSHPASTNCVKCHFNYTNASVDKPRHINGVVDIDATCIDCHGDAAGMGSRREVVSEFGLTWSHLRSRTGKTPTKWDCVVCHMEGNVSDGKPSSVHGDTMIDLRDPDTGNHIKGVTFDAASTLGGTTAGGYTETASDFAFPSFSRDLSLPLESDPNKAAIQAIMVNQCLKCHDSNGAGAFNAGFPLNPLITNNNIPGASASKPFGSTISYSGIATNLGGTTTAPIGANSTPGGVINVKSSFAATNSSYHPILGRNNNSFVTGNRAATPWKGVTGRSTTTTATPGTNTNFGYLMSCWDCHAPNGTASTALLTKTVTAHGGASTVRGSPTVPTVTSMPAATTNEANLCKLCHAGYDTASSSHSTGSAFTSGNSGMTTYVRFACNLCHSSGYNTAVIRPIRGEDAHGVNVLPTTGLAKQGRWAGLVSTCRSGSSTGPACTTAQVDARPYAFIRNTATLQEQTPVRIGTTYWTSTCTMTTNTPNSGADCAQGPETGYGGGTF